MSENPRNLEKLRAIANNKGADENLRAVAAAVVDIYERIRDLKANDVDLLNEIRQLQARSG